MPGIELSARRPGRPLLQRPLAVAFLLALGMDAASALSATSLPPPRAPDTVVTNCNDAGPGSLRDAIGSASDGETLDLSQLACSVISLDTGAILVGSQDLTLRGPGGHRLLLRMGGDWHESVIYDLAGGTLTIEGIDIAGGNKYSSDQAAGGGCVHASGDLVVSGAHVVDCAVHTGAGGSSGGALFANGFVTLIDTTIEQCRLVSQGQALGGGVFAGTGLAMVDSTISGCEVTTPSTGRGGGVYTGGNFTAKYSTLSGNDVGDTLSGSGGGAYTRGQVIVYWSTLSGNSAGSGGALYMAQGTGDASATLGASTISGNTARTAGGIQARVPLTVRNSTIAFNWMPRPDSFPIGIAPTGGLSLMTAPVLVTSSIIAGNEMRGDTDEPSDVGGRFEVVVDGSANLIGDSALDVPGDTVTGDPLLGPLRPNGGPTWTHALLPGSPALDAGDGGSMSSDQRGNGFPRVIGARADIGAYERDPDRIFIAGFD